MTAVTMNRAALEHIVRRLRELSAEAYELKQDDDATHGLGKDIERVADDLLGLCSAPGYEDCSEPLPPDAATFDANTTVECVTCGHKNLARYFTTGRVQECPECCSQDIALPGGTIVRLGQRKVKRV